MSEHHQFIFPRYRHLPAADWKALERQLLARGWLEPAAADALDETGDSDDSLWCSPLYRPSAELFRRLGIEADPAQIVRLFEFEPGQPFVCAGENFTLPAQYQQAQVAEETFMQFMGDAIEAPHTTWRSPEEGTAYYLMDLDWNFSFGVGEQVLRSDRLNRAEAERLAALIGELAGQPMSCAHRHR
ncbi:hypothetical protein ABE525_05270 [Pseudomonas wadenswilerensis]|uniref:hypothetical protein n=1 Tax=Pseudomonas wadenswilerensis TaxID=1785161 RepID=UPI000FC15303|nr:hypothetical protein [Pseudomonas wadenswilerensis]UVM22682.1 hypothetical protein LOY45_03690 [Pseudomonas wadenswilerensis]